MKTCSLYLTAVPPVYASCQDICRNNKRERILAERQKCDTALEKINHKIRVYENAVKTGVLNWESDTCGCSSEKG